MSWSFRIATISRNSETDGMQIGTSSRSNVYQIVSGMMEVIIFLFPNDRLDRFVRESFFFLVPSCHVREDRTLSGSRRCILRYTICFEKESQRIEYDSILVGSDFKRLL